MPLQHHFVVVIEGDRAYIDDETTNDKFYYGSVYDTDSDEWEATYERYQESERAQELLQDLLMRRVQ